MIELRYGLTADGVVSLTSVCRRLGLSAEAVREIERQALALLAHERELQALA